MQKSGSHNIGKSGWAVPILFFLAIIADILIFTFHNWSELPERVLPFFLLKISAALFFAGLVFFFKGRRWTVFFVFLLSVWILANQVYLRSNGLCFDGYSSTLIGNLKGFGGGILGLFEWCDLWYLAVPVVYVILFAFLGKPCRTRLFYGLAAILISVLSGYFGMFLINRDTPQDERCLNPFSARMHDLFPNVNAYCREVSVSHLFVYAMSDVARIWAEKGDEVDTGFLPDEERDLAQLFHPERKGERRQYKDTVVIILVESLESWAVHGEIMPNLEKFSRGDNVLFAGKVKPQILAGTSSDGQFIVNSGLLPIDHGAVCFTYPLQTYPSIASNAAGKTVVLVPHSEEVWNQKQMSLAEGYQGTVRIGESDEEVFGSLLEYVKDGYQVVQTLTLSSHVPFTYGSKRSSLVTFPDMPLLMSNYVKSMNYTDGNIEAVLSQTKEGGLLHNATVIITGDHTIFYKDKRKAMHRYCNRAGLSYSVEEPYCPLIIYSPHIKGNVRVEEECFQMDIYPTVIALLGNPDPVWDGFGIDLSDGDSRRAVTAERAMRLGNKVIRNNLFKDMR